MLPVVVLVTINQRASDGKVTVEDELLSSFFVTKKNTHVQ